MPGKDLIGSYQHTVDVKGRVFLPAKQREKLGETVYMTRGLDRCVFLFSEAGWEEFISGLASLPVSRSREAQRYFGGNAAQSDIDGQGRIMIPSNLRDFAGLKKSVTMVGVLGRVEIWDSDKWDEFNNNVSDETISEILEGQGF